MKNSLLGIALSLLCISPAMAGFYYVDDSGNETPYATLSTCRDAARINGGACVIKSNPAPDNSWAEGMNQAVMQGAQAQRQLIRQPYQNQDPPACLSGQKRNYWTGECQNVKQQVDDQAAASSESAYGDDWISAHCSNDETPNQCRKRLGIR